MKKLFYKYYKQIITSFLIISIISLSFLPLSIIYAQGTTFQDFDVTNSTYNTQGSYKTTGNTSLFTGGVSNYIQVLGPAIKNLPLCKDMVNKKVKGLFEGITGKKTTSSAKTAVEDATLKATKQENEVASIKTIDLTMYEINQRMKKELEEQKESIVAQEENEACLKSIGKMIVKLMLQKITAGTVDWINSGYDGMPMYVDDMIKFSSNIRAEKILQFAGELNDIKRYPFGKAFVQNKVRQVQNSFAYNARYSMDELMQSTTPQFTSKDFNSDFSKGGWSAWNFLTQIDANNPLGFHLMAQDELLRRVEQEAIKRDNELNRGDGFLSDERCLDPDPNITKSMHMAALEKGEKEYTSYFIDNNLNGDPDHIEEAEGKVVIRSMLIPLGEDNEVGENPTGYILGTCKKWEYVTPGKMIAESATKLINYPDNYLLSADDLNTSIAAILDAVLNQMTSKIQNQGLASYKMSGSYTIDSNNLTSNMYSQTEIDFPPSMMTDWLKEHPDFDIRTDLNQAIIDEQRIYQQKLKDENRITEILIKTIYQLDYCIPGPNPDWEEESEYKLQLVKNAIPGKSLYDFENESLVTTIFESIISSIPIIGEVADWKKMNWLKVLLNVYYSQYFKKITNVELMDLDYFYERMEEGPEGQKWDEGWWTNVTNTFGIPPIGGKTELTNTLDYIFKNYSKLIKYYYSKENLPTSTQNAKIQFQKINGHKQRILENEYAISTLDGVITRLGKLKDTLDAMDPETVPYSDYLPIINEFARLSETMVTGDNIQKADNARKEKASQIKYVYEDLLIGPFGCEKQLTEEYGLNQTLKTIPRRIYPHAHWYEYDGTGPYPTINDTVLADLKEFIAPDKINTNTRPTQNSSYGPGFLSRVYFETENDTCSTAYIQIGNNILGNEMNCIVITKFFNKIYENGVFVGRNEGDPEDKEQNTFEDTIEIY